MRKDPCGAWLGGGAVAVAAVAALAAVIGRPAAGAHAALPAHAAPTKATTPALPAALSASDALEWAASRTFVAVVRADGVWVCDLESGAQVKLPGVLAAPGELRFSPRGDRLACSLKVGGSSDVYLVDLSQKDGPRLHQLTLHGGGEPRWLGHGERLLYCAPDGRGGFGLFVRDEDGLGHAADFWDEHPVRAPAVGVTISQTLTPLV